MKSSHTNSVQKIKNTSFASFKTLSNSPKVNQMYESLKYFAPIVHTNEKQMIQQIRSMGKQILEPEREIQLQLPKPKMQIVAEQKLIQQIDKLNRATNLKRTFYQNPKFGIDESLMNRSLTQSRQKSFLSQREKWEEMKKNVNGLYTSRNSVKTPTSNLYDKYKFQVKINNFKNLQTKTQALKEDLKYLRNDKPNQQQRREQKQKFDKKLVLNYTKFVDKNIKKILKQEKQQNQRIVQKDKFINVFDPKLKQYVKKPLKTHATKRQIQRSVQKINQKIIQSQLKKNDKVSKMREQQVKKQMQNVTFKPKLQTSNFHSKHQILRNNPSLQNFQKRLTIDQQLRKSHEKEIIFQILQKSPFKPRLNPPSPHITSQSKIKSLWNSTHISMNSNLSISMQNLKKSSLITDDRSIDQKSIPTTGISIKTSPQQLSFLFN